MTDERENRIDLREVSKWILYLASCVLMAVRNFDLYGLESTTLALWALGLAIFFGQMEIIARLEDE